MIHAIRAKFVSGQFEFSQHALDQSLRRKISVAEIRQASDTFEIIENYPDDKYGPSCLLLGFTDAGRPLHIHCTYPSRPLLKVITLYEPDVDQWIHYRERVNHG